MNAESEFWDEMADHLVVIYNRIRLVRGDLRSAEKAAEKYRHQLSVLEEKAAHYEALFASDIEEGTPA